MDFLTLLALVLAIIALVKTRDVARKERRLAEIERIVNQQSVILARLMSQSGLNIADHNAPESAAVNGSLKPENNVRTLSSAATAASVPLAATPGMTALPHLATATTPPASIASNASPLSFAGAAAARQPSTTESPRATSPQFPSAPSDPKAQERAARRAETRQLLRANWTGIVGALILVAGVAFFGLIASLSMGPEGRFALILAFAAMVYGGSLWLSRRPLWASFGAWLQGVSGAVTLLACVGAGGFDGLRFIDEPLIALGVLLAGIGLNLVLAYQTRFETLAALHVVASLVAMGIAPATPTTILVGAIVTLAGIGLSLRQRWDVNLLIIIVSFAIYHMVWADRIELTMLESRPFGVTATLAVALAAAAIHYRRQYAAARFAALPLGVHIVNWGALALSLMYYSSGSQWTGALLGVAAIATSLAARIAKRRNIRWLHVTDTLVGQSLAICAVFFLGRLGLTSIDMAWLIVVELVLFTVVGNLERDEVLTRIGYAFQWCALIAFVCLAGFDVAQSHGEANFAVASRIAMVALALLGQHHAAARWRLDLDAPQFIVHGKRGDFASQISPLVLMSAPLLVSSLFVLPQSWAFFAVSAALGGLFLYRTQIESRSLELSLQIALSLIHAGAWSRLVGNTGSPTKVLTLAMPPLFLDVILLSSRLLWSERTRTFVTQPAAYLAIGSVIALDYALALPLSDFAPGVLFLVESLIALELALYFARNNASATAPSKNLEAYALHGGYLLLGLFINRHLLVHLQSEASLGPVPIRAIIALFGFATLVYWLANTPQLAAATKSRLNRYLSPYLWETVLVFSTIACAIELPRALHPLAWATAAVLLYALTEHRRWPARIAYASWLYLLASVVQLAVATSMFETQSESWLERPEIMGPVAMAVQFAYLALVYRRGGYPPESGSPPALLPLVKLAVRAFERGRNALLFYPVIIGLSIFLFWRFDHAVLTLLWVLEVFVVCALGIFVREKHFIQVGMGFLMFCVGRLIIYDLDQSNLLVRAAVFVGVGGLMLGINALYRKFKSRIE